MMAYLCKAMFSVVTVIKSKYHKDISMGQEVKVVMPKLIPKTEELVIQYPTGAYIPLVTK